MERGGKAPREKGKRWEREVTNIMKEIWPESERQGWKQVYFDGIPPPDVSAGPYHVECKHGKSTSPAAALAQANEDRALGKIPIAVCKNDRQPPFVVMYLDDWLQLNRDARMWKLQ